MMKRMMKYDEKRLKTAEKLKQINSVLKEANSFALACHKNADGDGLGSALALHLFLKNTGKESRVFVQDESAKEFRFLPGFEEIETEAPFFLPEVAIGLDYGAFPRLDFPDNLKESILAKEIFFISIDHHLENGQLGEIILLDETASSTSEIIVDFFRANELEINKEIATCLLTGIITDTNNFRHPSTTAKTLETASWLVKKGVLIEKVNKAIAKKNGGGTSRSLALAFNNLKINKKFEFSYLALDYQTIRKNNVRKEDLDGIASVLAGIPQTKFSLVLFEWEPGKTKGSLRSQNSFNVSEIAGLFGGGGHLLASGFETEKTPRETYEELIEKIEKMFNN